MLGDLPTVAIVSSWKAWWDIDKLLTPLSAASAYKLSFVDEVGWPESANHMFVQTAQLMAEHYPDEAWYFMEADTCPIKKGWFQALEEEYNRVGKPYMGVISNTVRGNPDGEFWITGQHMTGTAIYPADFLDRCKEIHFLMREPWDIAIGKEVVPFCHHTKLIAHRWSSYGYYLKDGVIQITKSRAANKFSSTHVQPIPPEAVVVHGCKDSSIYALDLALVVE
jgi:hypothetical protein